jgi:hypothetical protein
MSQIACSRANVIFSSKSFFVVIGVALFGISITVVKPPLIAAIVPV